MSTEHEFKYNLPQRGERSEIEHGDLRVVSLPVEVVFQWSDKIVADFDSETNTVLEYTSGYIMKVLPNQEFLFRGEDTTFVAQTLTK
jgi:hypothetical protein